VLGRTTVVFIVACAAELVAEHAATPPAVMGAIHFLFVIAAAIQAALWARELIIGVVEHRAELDAEHRSLASAVGIIRLLVTVALFAIALILILANLGVNVTGLIAGLGIGGIAIGLAAQGIFSDLFAALSIVFDRPFRIGDQIRFDDVVGHVENIGLKTTRLRSVTGEQVVIANGKLLEKRILNFGGIQKRAMTLAFGLVNETAPGDLERVPEIVRTVVEAHKKVAMIRCGLTGFGASSLDFETLIEVRTPDWDYAFAARSAIVAGILKAIGEAGLRFAYPTQTTYTAAPDGTLVMPWRPEGPA
jgi:small-conductance mechanosensitive channel